MALRFLLASLLLASISSLGACKGATNGKPPVDHPMYEYHPPEELTEAEDEEEEEEEDEAEDGGEGEGAQ